MSKQRKGQSFSALHRGHQLGEADEIERPPEFIGERRLMLNSPRQPRFTGRPTGATDLFASFGQAVPGQLRTHASI
jgi:hypothetical protein